MEITRRRLAICVEVLKSLDEQGFFTTVDDSPKYILEANRVRKDAQHLVDYLEPHVNDIDWYCTYDDDDNPDCECNIENLDRRL